MKLLATCQIRAQKHVSLIRMLSGTRWRFVIAALVIGGMLLSIEGAWARNPPVDLPPPPPTQTVITPGSPEGQSIANAANLLEKMGETATAQRVRDRLNAGQYSYGHVDGNAETQTSSQYTNINVGTIWIVDLPAYRGVTLDPNKNFSELFSLARTLFHEDIHSGQSYFAGLYELSPWEKKHETEAWSKTIAAEASWIYNGYAQHTFTPQQLAIMARNLSSYIGSWGELNFHGLDNSAIAAFRNIAAEMDGLAQRFDTMAIQPGQGASSSASNPPVSSPPDGRTAAGGPSTPQPPAPPPQPPAPAPQTPAQVCPECLVYLQAVIELRNELAQVQAQVAAQNANIANNQIAQRAAQAKIAALQAALAAEQGIGGSGYDPTTGLTRQSVTQVDGTVLVTVKDANGDILEQSVRNRSDLAGVQRDLSAAQAQLESLKAEAAALAKERDRLVVRQQVLTARLQDAIQQLADCLEKKCSHLIGQRLNTIAEQFGLDPLTGKPAPPKATGNTPTGGTGASNAANEADTAAGNAANKANETKISTPPMESGANAGNAKPVPKGALPSGEPGSSNNNGGENNDGNNNGEDNGANNGNAGDNPPPPPPPPAANPQPAAEKRPKNFRHAQPATDSTGITEPNQYTVTVCEGTNDYVFRASGEEVDARNVKSTSPNATGVGFGSGVRISGNHVGSSTIDADFLRFDGTLAAHVKIFVTVIDCGHHTAVVPGGNPPPANPNPPVATGGGGNGNSNPPGGEDNNPNPPVGGDSNPPPGGNAGVPGGFMGVLDGIDEANNALFGNAPDAPGVQNIVITINVNIGGTAPATTGSTSGALQVAPTQTLTANRRPVVQGHTRVRPAAFHLGSPSRAPSVGRSTGLRTSRTDLTSLPTASRLTFSIASNGNLGSNALQFRVHDPSGKLKGNITLPEGMVLQPLKPGTPNPVSNASGVGNSSQQLTAYCLEMAKLPPEVGQLYRLAPPAVQQRYQPIRSVLQAGSKLAAARKFHPDSDPAAYADFIRQHALWAQLENWSEQNFTEVFVERTKKNAEQMNVKWTNEMTDALRAAAPGRWRDIAMVLAEAHKLSSAAGAP